MSERDDSDTPRAVARTPPLRKQKRLPFHGRGAGFTRKEVVSMLRVVKEMLPVSSEDWDDVHRAHSATYREVSRTADSLRRKFLALCRATTGSGASCSNEVREAKRIRQFILQRADVADGESKGNAAVLSAFEDEESDSNALTRSPVAAEGTCTPIDDATASTNNLLHRPQRSATNVDIEESDPNVPTRTQTSTEDARAPISNATAPISSLPIPLIPSAVNTDIVELLKMQILASHEEERRRREADELWRQEVREMREQERAEERERRAEERRERELERQEERKWREEAARRHEQLIEAIMLLIAKK
ncbi:hypothetical protein FI667_g9156, partial [Globisporangium splendens]